MVVDWDSSDPSHLSAGRNRGELGAYLTSWFARTPEAEKIVQKLNLRKPGLPPGMNSGGHGGSHAYLTCDFIDSILRDRKPCVDIVKALK